MSHNKIYHIKSPVQGLFSMVGILLVAALLSAGCTYTAAKEVPVLKHWGYMVPGTLRINSARAFRNSISRYDVIALTCLKLRRDGKLIYHKAKEEDYFNGSSGPELVFTIVFQSPRDGTVLLSNRNYISNAVKEIYAFAVEKNIHHLHFDFEYLSRSMVPALKIFLSEMKNSLSKNTLNTEISMAVFPQVDFPEQWSSFHDLSVLSRCCDSIVLMCYDYHRSGTPPGPVTDMEWTGKNIRHALKHFPGDRIWLGMPAYGYAWRHGKEKASSVSARFGEELNAGGKCVRHRSGTLKCVYARDGFPVTAYIADGKTMEFMEALAAEYGLRGTALWRIGFE